MTINLSYVLIALLFGILLGILLGISLGNVKKISFFQKKSWTGENRSLGVNQFRQKFREGVTYFDISQNDRGGKIHVLIKFEKGSVKLIIPTVERISTYSVFKLETSYFWYLWEQQKKNAGERVLGTMIRMRNTLARDETKVKILKVDATLSVAKIDF